MKHGNTHTKTRKNVKANATLLFVQPKQIWSFVSDKSFWFTKTSERYQSGVPVVSDGKYVVTLRFVDKMLRSFVPRLVY